ncbi:MAG: hypothetical protein KDA96_22540 [Planctomycetaceae bacterium]|nr:hypothetical protein [Planctomycetaceae bacterium]
MPNAKAVSRMSVIRNRLSGCPGSAFYVSSILETQAGTDRRWDALPWRQLSGCDPRCRQLAVASMLMAS